MNGKNRYCPVCGDDMGFIENRFFDSRDTCGARECEREMRDEELAEREEAHERLDRDMGWF